MTAPAPDKPSRPGSRRSLIQIAAVLVVSIVAVGLYIWQTLKDVDIGVNGYVALSLGVIGTAALGAGLMALVFYSNRHGYDDGVAGGGDSPRDEDGSRE